MRSLLIYDFSFFPSPTLHLSSIPPPPSTSVVVATFPILKQFFHQSDKQQHCTREEHEHMDGRVQNPLNESSSNQLECSLKAFGCLRSKPAAWHFMPSRKLRDDLFHFLFLYRLPHRENNARYVTIWCHQEILPPQVN